MQRTLYAAWDENDPLESYLYVTKEFPIAMRDIIFCKLHTNGNPLVIFNACETGNLNPLHSIHFASTFLKCGARGVVATECSVPDNFASEFIKYLYPKLLKNVPLGLSLLETRRHFFSEYGNPSGLLYSMYASASTTLMKRSK